LPAARRRPLPRARRRAPRARDLRQRLLCLCASVRRGGGARGARCDAADDAPGAAGAQPLPPSDRRRPPHDNPRPRPGGPRRPPSDRGEAPFDLEVPGPDAWTSLRAMARKRGAFPLVGVAAARRGTETTVALAGVAPIPWLLESTLDDATPLPGTAYKVEIA